MLKPIYGLNDAPRAWRKKLHQIFAPWMPCRVFYWDPELYCVHGNNNKNIGSTIERTKQHDLEQQEINDIRSVPAIHYEPVNFRCLLPMHVDDIKSTSPRDIADS